MKTYETDLIDAVIDQIGQDCVNGDYTAIEELLKSVPPHNLEGYLPEEIMIDLQGKWA